MMESLLLNLEIIVATIFIAGSTLAAASFTYSYFYGKISDAFDHLDRIDQIESDTKYTLQQTEELSEQVSEQGDILIALTKAHDPNQDVNIDVGSIEAELGREPPYKRFVDGDPDDD